MSISMDDLKPMKPFYIPEPTRFYKIGDKVRVGNLKNVRVVEVSEDKKLYKIMYDTETIGRSPPTYHNEMVCEWHNLKPVLEEEPPSFIDEDRFFLNFSQSQVESLLHMVYHCGVDGDVEYQREMCWTAEQKEALIDSIFQGIDIGKFVFIYRKWRDEMESGGIPYYEILDGKQRLNALVEFYEDRFTYNGKKFSELSRKDIYHFKNHPIARADVPERFVPNRNQLYKYFLKLNVLGVPQSEDHLEKVKKMLED